MNEQRTGLNRDIQEAISWYDKVKIEGGNGKCKRMDGALIPLSCMIGLLPSNVAVGVKFMLDTFGIESSLKMYLFTTRHVNDTYTCKG